MLKQVVILMFSAFITNALLAMDDSADRYPNHYAGKPNAGQLSGMASWIEEKQSCRGLTIPGLDVPKVIQIGYNYARLSPVIHALLLANNEEANAVTLDRTLNGFGINTTSPRDGVTIRWRANALEQKSAPSSREYAQMWHDVLRCEIADGNEEGNPQAKHCSLFLTEQKGIVERFLASTQTVAKPAEKKPSTTSRWPCTVL
jgi:hypothetical protein